MGDLKNVIKKLHSSTRLVKFDFGSNLKELSTGAPTHYLTLYHYLFLNYSPAIATEILTKHQLELQNKSDKTFMEGVYKLLRDMFDYVPKLTQTQFFMTSYAQVKATMACEIINLIQQKAKSLQPPAALISTSMASKSSSSLSSQQAISTNGQQPRVSLHRSASVRSTSSLGRRPLPSATINKAPTSIHNHLSVANLLPSHSTHRIETPSIHLSNETNVKIEQLETELNETKSKLRLVETKLDTLMRQNEALLLAQQQQPRAVNQNIVQINRTELENILSRLTVMETEVLMRRQSKSSNQRIEDQNETTFHSFLNTSDMNSSVIQSRQFNETPTRNAFMCQGVAVDYDKIDDHSLNSNDSTPTMTTTSKESRFDTTINDNVTIMKAKDAVLRASLFCNNLVKINQQTKAQ